jgi:hypothetical protein
MQNNLGFFNITKSAKENNAGRTTLGEQHWEIETGMKW